MRAGALKGHTTPRLFTPPLRELTPETSLGYECCEFLEDVLGWTLRPWQRWLYIHALELLEDGGYRFDTLLILIARQNGKTQWLIGLALWRLYCDMAALVISSAQDLDKAEETLDEAYGYISECDELAPECVQYVQTNGKRRIVLSGRRRWKAQTASRKGGRSLSADLAVLDELREHQSWAAWSAIAPTTSAVARSMVVAASNAGDNTSIVLRSLRDKAKKKIELDQTADTRVGMFEWSAPEGVPYMDPQYWPYANPSLGYGLTLEKLAGFAESMPEAEFRTEHMCQWVDTIIPGVFPEGSWDLCRDPDSRRADGARLHVSVDVSWNRAWAHIVIAAERSDGAVHVELVASRAGTDWVCDWFRDRLDRMPEVVVQARGAPASSLIPALREVKAEGADGVIRKLEVIEWGGADLASASGQFYDAVMNRRIRHRGQPRLSTAAELARSKQSGDAWIFERKNSAGDPSPVVAGVAAVWRALQPVEDEGRSAYEDYDDADLMFA